jgi:hypothetical protein
MDLDSNAYYNSEPDLCRKYANSYYVTQYINRLQDKANTDDLIWMKIDELLLELSVDKTPPLKLVICEALVAVPNNGTIGPTPCLKKHSQNIQLGLCFTVAETQKMLYSSLGSRQTLLHRDC